MDINENCVKSTASIKSKFSRIMAKKPYASPAEIFQMICERDVIRCRIKLEHEEEYCHVIN